MHKHALSVFMTVLFALSIIIPLSTFAGDEWDVRIAGRINNAEIVSFADASNGIITAVAKVAVDGICQ